MKESTITVPVSNLNSACVNAFRNAGVSNRDAQVASDSLLDASLRGIDSHGVVRLPKYVRGLKRGTINPRPKISVTRSAKAVSQVDGDNGLGAVVASRATREVIRLCKLTGIAAVGVHSSNHYGTVSYYLLKAAAEGLIGIGFVHGESLQVAFGGMDPFFGTNPLAFAFPTRKSPPVSVDFATSTTTFGRIMQARAAKQLMPEGNVLDSYGVATLDPEKAAKILPASGHKGYGLALAVEVLSAILNGCPFGPHVAPVFRDDIEAPGQLGHLFLAIDPSCFFGSDRFLSQMEKMIQELHQTTPRPGGEPVLVPGDPENRTHMQRSHSGVPIPVDLWKTIQQLASDNAHTTTSSRPSVKVPANRSK